MLLTSPVKVMYVQSVEIGKGNKYKGSRKFAVEKAREGELQRNHQCETLPFP